MCIRDRYQVSKTPVREALSMLVQEGYLKKIPRVGYLVREVTEEDYYKLIYLRFTLEKGVVLRIIRHCTEEEILSLREHCREEQVSYQDFGGVNYDFHMAMAQLTGNEYLAEEVRRIFQWTIRAPSVNLYQEVLSLIHIYPTDISKPPAMMTNIMPNARMPLIDACFRILTRLAG